MSVVQFQCPSCQAPLRLENRALYIGRTFACPDCRESLLIESDGSSGVKAKAIDSGDRLIKARTLEQVGVGKLASSPTRPAGAANASQGLGLPLPPRISGWRRMAHRPAVAGWIVAGLLALMLMIALGTGREREQPREIRQPNVARPSSEEATAPVVNDNLDKAPASNAGPRIVEPEKTPGKDEASDPAVNAALSVPPLPAQPPVRIETPREDRPKLEFARPAEPAAEEPKPLSPEKQPILTAEAVEVKLQQKIIRFEQLKPVPFIKVLDVIEELAGVPIVWDLAQVDDEQLQKPVTIQLNQTTVSEILDSLLKQVTLGRRTVEGKIELHLPKSSNDDDR